MSKSLPILVILLLAQITFQSCKNNKEVNPIAEKQFVLTSPLGKELRSPLPSIKLLNQLEEAKKNYDQDSFNADNIIWYGRRTAYLGHYDDAITIFTEGINKFPEDARMYRHRGHRYISIRQFEKAVNDLERAAALIQGQKNEVEPDGMPNAQNIPVSTLHGNIWYHLGLAYYLLHDYEKAFKAYQNCRNSSSNDDNIVSSTHWLYMIQRRLGNLELANEMLHTVKKEAHIIENTNYYNLCKFYNGWIAIDSLMVNGSMGAANDAVKYGIANWHFYNNNKEEASILMDSILKGNSWSSFGYIAAESDKLYYFSN
jgi:tetratricopeptide (TPR) repeat protein